MIVSWTMLAVQTALAAAMIRLLAVRVLPPLHRYSQSGLVLDVWLPLSLVFPLLAQVRGAQPFVAVNGWALIAAPLTLAVLGFGMAIFRVSSVNGSSSRPQVLRPRLAGFCAGIGALVLLLGAAHDLTVWIGQVCFAIAAVLLWMNTPDTIAADPSTSETEFEGRIGGGLALIVLCGLGLAGATLLISDELRTASTAVGFMTAAFTLAITARLAGPPAGARLAGWVSIYGVLFGLGAISLAQLVPHVLRTLDDPQTTPPMRVAYGFGAFAPEAMAMLVAAGLCIAAERFSATVQRIAGIAIIVIAATGAEFRLALLWHEYR